MRMETQVLIILRLQHFHFQQKMGQIQIVQILFMPDCIGQGEVIQV